jgi:hypothetical protein
MQQKIKSTKQITFFFATFFKKLLTIIVDGGFLGGYDWL